MRKSKKRNFMNVIVIIVDGKDEKWYIEKVKEHYPGKSIKTMKITPELYEKKKVGELFAYAKQKVGEDYNKVILILDKDNILKDNSEYERFKTYYANYQNVKYGTSKEYEWMSKLLLILNTPCLEFWYLLHFGKTTKFYSDFEGLKSDLRKCTNFRDYEKSETYYKKSPDIFNRLGGVEGVDKACANAHAFSLEEAKTRGVSELNLLFQFFKDLDNS